MIVLIRGGLGNQMFQAAYAASLEERFGIKSILIDATGASATKRHWALDTFGWEPTAVSPTQLRLLLLLEKITRVGLPRCWRRYLGLLLEEKPTIPVRTGKHGPWLVSGYWQGCRYIQPNHDEVKALFRFPAVDVSAFDWWPNGYCTVGMHVRRGDYTTSAEAKRVHNVCGAEWYSRAARLVRSKTPHNRILIFSEDITWVQNHVELEGDVVYVPFDQKRPAWIDMYALSCCNHFVLSNSSFSWWAAFLGARSGSYVYAPSEWYSGVSARLADMLLPNWNVVSVETK